MYLIGWNSPLLSLFMKKAKKTGIFRKKTGCWI